MCFSLDYCGKFERLGQTGLGSWSPGQSCPEHLVPLGQPQVMEEAKQMEMEVRSYGDGGLVKADMTRSRL